MLIVVRYLGGELAACGLQGCALGLHLQVEVGLHLLRCLLLHLMTRSGHVNRVGSARLLGSVGLATTIGKIDLWVQVLNGAVS